MHVTGEAFSEQLSHPKSYVWVTVWFLKTLSKFGHKPILGEEFSLGDPRP